MPKLQKVDDKEEPVPPKRLRRGNVPGKKSPPSPISAKKPATPPVVVQTTKTIAARGKSKGGKNATPQKGKKRRKAMPSIHEDSDKEQSLLSPPTASRKTGAPSPMTAAAAGTLAYLNQYSEHGGGGSRAGEAVESEEELDLLEDGHVVISHSSKKNDWPLKSIVDEAQDDDKDGKEPDEPDDEEDVADFAADGLDFSDDDDALDIHIDSDDKLHTSFPKNKLRKNMILGGPQAPDPAGLTEDEYKKKYSKFRRERKRYTDKMRSAAAKRSQAFGGGSSGYSGCCYEQLRTLNEVDSHPLETGQTFPGKDILHI